MPDRSILHVDVNACYASIELLHRPELRGLPVAVGGDAEARHGIILAKSEEAKAFGIKTGEVLWQARQKCPNLVVLKPNYQLYLRFSRMLRELLVDYTDQVESFGLDECWLDVTGSTHLFGSGTEIAEKIRERVKRELGVTVSVGASFNKVFAKLGSDMKKPDAVTAIGREDYKEKVWPLPAEELLYVGRSTKHRLNKYGIFTIGDIARADPALLQSWFGKWGLVLNWFSNGMDSSPVARAGDEAVIKSIGNSTTTPRDLTCEQDAKIIFYMLSESVASRLREAGFRCKTVQISLRDNELFSFERQMILSQPSCISGELCVAAMKLLRGNYSWQKPLRSIGIRGCDLVPVGAPAQLTLLEDENQRIRREQLEHTVDDIRRRFGHYSIGRAVNHLDTTLGRIDPKGDHTIHPIGFFRAM